MEILEFLTADTAVNAIDQLTNKIQNLAPTAQAVAASASTSLGEIKSVIQNTQAEAKRLINDSKTDPTVSAAASNYLKGAKEQAVELSKLMEDLKLKGFANDPWVKELQEVSTKLAKYDAEVQGVISTLKLELQAKSALADAEAKYARELIEVVAKKAVYDKATTDAIVKVKEEIAAKQALLTLNRLLSDDGASKNAIRSLEERKAIIEIIKGQISIGAQLSKEEQLRNIKLEEMLSRESSRRREVSESLKQQIELQRLAAIAAGGSGPGTSIGNKADIEAYRRIINDIVKELNAESEVTSKLKSQERELATSLLASNTVIKERIEMLKAEKALASVRSTHFNLSSSTGGEGQTLAAIIQERARLNELNKVATQLAEARGRAEAKSNPAYQEQKRNLEALVGAENKVTEARDRARRGLEQSTHLHNFHAQALASFRAGLTSLGLQFGIYTSGTFAIAASTYAVGRAFRTAASEGIEFQNTVIQAASVLAGIENTFEQYKQLTSQTAIGLSLKTPFSATEISKAVFELSVGGQSAKNIFGSLSGASDEAGKAMKSSLIPVLNLATIGMMDVGKAADITTNIMEGFHIPAKATAEVVSVMAYAALRSNMTIEQMGTALSYVAPIAYQTGQSLQDVSAMLEALHNAGIKGSRAGTAMRKLLTDMYDPSSKLSEMLAKASIASIDFSGNSINLISILEKTKKALDEGVISMSDIAKATGLYAESGILALVSASARLSEAQKNNGMSAKEASDEFEREAKSIRELQEELELAAKGDVAGLIVQRFSTSLSKQLSLLKNSVSLVGLIPFNEVQDELTSLTKDLTAFFQRLAYSPEMAAFSKGLESVIITASTVVKNELVPAFHEFYSFISPIASAFTSVIGTIITTEGVLKNVVKLLLLLATIQTVKTLGTVFMWLYGAIIANVTAITSFIARLSIAAYIALWTQFHSILQAIGVAVTAAGGAMTAAGVAASVLSGGLIAIAAISLGALIYSLSTVEAKLTAIYVAQGKLDELDKTREKVGYNPSVVSGTGLVATGLNAVGAAQEQVNLMSEQLSLAKQLSDLQTNMDPKAELNRAVLLQKYVEVSKQLTSASIVSESDRQKFSAQYADEIDKLDKKLDFLRTDSPTVFGTLFDTIFGSERQELITGLVETRAKLVDVKEQLDLMDNPEEVRKRTTSILSELSKSTTQVGQSLASKLDSQGGYESEGMAKKKMEELQNLLGIVDSFRVARDLLKGAFSPLSSSEVVSDSIGLPKLAGFTAVSLRELSSELEFLSSRFGIPKEKVDATIEAFAKIGTTVDGTTEKFKAIAEADRKFNEMADSVTDPTAKLALQQHTGDKRDQLLRDLETQQNKVKKFEDDRLAAATKTREELEKQADLKRDISNMELSLAEKSISFASELNESSRELKGVRKDFADIVQDYTSAMSAAPTFATSVQEQMKTLDAALTKVKGQSFISEDDKKRLEDMMKAMNISMKSYSDSVKSAKEALVQIRAEEKRNMEVSGFSARSVQLTPIEFEAQQAKYGSISNAVKAYNLALAETNELVGKYISKKEQQMVLDDAYLRVLQASGDAVGVYFEKLRQQAEDLRPLFAQIFSDMESALARALETGKLDFKEFVDYIKSMLAKLAAQQIMLSIGDIFGLSGNRNSGAMSIPSAAFAMAGGSYGNAQQQQSAGPFASPFAMMGWAPQINGYIPNLPGNQAGGGGMGNYVPNLFSNPFASTIPWATYAAGTIAGMFGGTSFGAGLAGGLGAAGAGGLFGAASQFGAGAAMVGQGAVGAGLGSMAGAAIPFIGWIVAIVSIVASILKDKDAPRFGLRGGLGEAEFSESGLKKSTTDKVMQVVKQIDEAVIGALGPELTNQINQSGKLFSTGTYKSDKEQGFINALWKRYQLILGEVDKSLADSVKDLDRSSMDSFIAGLMDILAPLKRMQVLLKSLQGSNEIKVLGFDSLKTGIEMAKKFMKEGENVAQTLERITINTLAVNTAFDNLGMSLGLVGEQAIQVSQDIIDAFGGLDEFKSKFSFFQQQFGLAIPAKSPQSIQDSFQSRMDALDLPLPETREEFVALVQSIDWTTEAGRDLGVALLGAAEAADAFYDLKESAQALVKSFYILRDLPQNIAEELVTMFGSQQNAASSIGFFEQKFGPGGYGNNSYAMMNYLGTELAGLGLTLPTTREGFFDLVQSIDLSTEAGRKLWKSLMDLAPVADSFYSALEKMADEAQKAKDAIEEMRISVQNQISDAKQGFMLDTMSNPEKVMYWSTMFDQAIQGISTATSPDQVNSLVQQGIQAAQAIWATFSDEQKRQFLPQFLQMMADLQKAAEDRLKQLSAEVDLKHAADLLAIAGQDLTGAGAALTAAAMEMQLAAQFALAFVPPGLPPNPYGGAETSQSIGMPKQGMEYGGASDEDISAQVQATLVGAIEESNAKLSDVMGKLSEAILSASTNNKEASQSVNSAASKIVIAADMLASAAVSSPRSVPSIAPTSRRSEVGVSARR